MSPREHRGAAGLLLRQARADALLLGLVALVVAIAALLVTLGPAALAAVATRELRHTLDDFPAVRRDLTASGFFGYPYAGGTRSTDEVFSTISDRVDAIPARLGPPIAPLLGTAEWAVVSAPESVEAPRGDDAVGLRLSVLATPEWADEILVTEGRAPLAWAGDEDSADAAAAGPVEIALSRAVAEAMGIAVGDVLEFGVAPFEVTALYEPRNPDDPLWQHQRALAEPIEGRSPDGRKTLTASALVHPGSTAGLTQTLPDARLEAWYPLRTDTLTFAQAPAIAEQVRLLSATGERLPSGELLLFSTVLSADLTSIGQRVDVASALLALLVAGPLGVIFAVLALSAATIARRQEGALALARIRGASGVQLRAALLLEGLAVSLPAAALGVGGAVALSRAIGGEPTAVAVGVAAAAVALTPPVLLAASVPRAPAAGPSPAARYRWVAELIVVGLAAASVVLLARRGIVDSTAGVDPLLAATPLLVAAAGTLGMLRLFPLLMGSAHGAAHRGRGPVALVGAARAGRAPTLGFATAFALIVGISVSVFAGGIGVTLQRSLALVEPAARRDIPPLDAAHPLIAAVFVLLSASVAVAIGFCLIAVVLGVVAGSRRRNAVVGILRVLGLETRQLRGVVAWELAPVTLIAVVTGVLLGIAEVFVVGTAIDLPSFVGAAPAPPSVGLGPTVAIVAGTTAAIAVTAVVAARVAHRRAPAGTLRMGTE